MSKTHFHSFSDEAGRALFEGGTMIQVKTKGILMLWGFWTFVHQMTFHWYWTFGPLAHNETYCLSLV